MNVKNNTYYYFTNVTMLIKKDLEMKKEDKASEQLNRIRIFFKKDSIDQAFKVLGISKSTYANYYNREKLPDKLVSQLRDEYFMNPEWLKYGKGTSKLMQVNHIKESISRYGSSECMMICDAIKRRDTNYQEELVAKVLMFINSLDIPLGSREDELEKKE